MMASAELEIFIKQIMYVQIDAKGDFGWSDLADKVRKDATQAFIFQSHHLCLVSWLKSCINTLLRLKVHV